MDANQTKGLMDLLQFGAGGFVLLWFMFRCEPRLRAIERAIEKLTRAVLLSVISSASNPIKVEEARKILREIDDELHKRVE